MWEILSLVFEFISEILLPDQFGYKHINSKVISHTAMITVPEKDDVRRK